MDEIEELFSNEDTIDTTNYSLEDYELKRISFKYIFASILAVLNFEKGLLFTIKELIIRPRIVIEEYLKRDRKKLVHPIRFLIFSTALSSFLTIYFVHNSSDGANYANASFEKGVSIGERNSVVDSIKSSTLDTNLLIEKKIDSTTLNKKEIKRLKAKKFSDEFGEMILNMGDKFTFLLILFFSFFTFLFYRKNRYNLTENIVINSYLSSITNAVSILFLCIAIPTNNYIWMVIPSVISIPFIIYFWTAMYNRITVGGVFRGILTLIVSYIAFAIVIGIGIAIYVFIKLS